MPVTRLILGSGSPCRRALLERLGLVFSRITPRCDETPLAGESGPALAARLALSKAQSVAAQVEAGDDWVVIASDQVCHHRGDLFGKPGGLDRARAQLRRFNGEWVTFTTGVTLLCGDGRQHSGIEDFRIRFRQLTDADIDSYLRLDEPWGCAGSIRMEQAGPTLVADSLGRDINTLLGLPIMLLTELLAQLDYSITDFR